MKVCVYVRVYMCMGVRNFHCKNGFATSPVGWGCRIHRLCKGSVGVYYSPSRLGQETDTVTPVQFFDKAVCISHSINDLPKGTNPFILPLTMSE